MFGMVLLVVTFIALFIGAIRLVPVVHYGVVTRFGKRTGRVLNEGLNFVVPLADSVELYEYKLDTKIINFGFFSKDNIEVIIRMLVQWRPDWRITTEDGKNKFIENGEEAILQGMDEAVKSAIGSVIGELAALTFIGKKKVVEKYINSILRLNAPPHTNPSKIKSALGTEEITTMAERLKFYQKFSSEIDYLLKEEGILNQHSELEERYGIDIVAVTMSDVDFNENTQRALELKEQTRAKLKADELKKRKKVEMTRDFKELGLSPQSAVNAAEVTMGQAQKEVKSFEGLENLKPFGGK